MQYQFGIQMNQFGEALQLNSDDIQYWLNKGQLELVKEKYTGINRERRGFEQSQQRIDDLRILIRRDTKLDNIEHNVLTRYKHFESETGVLPNDYLFLIASRSKIAYHHPELNWERNDMIEQREPIEPFSEKRVSNRLVLHDHLYNVLDDPFNTTKPSSPVTIVNDNKVTVFSNKTFLVKEIIIDYLKMPRAMNIKEEVSSELPEHLHDEIIQRAVDLFLNNTRELKQRLQRETPVANKTQNIEENE